MTEINEIMQRDPLEHSKKDRAAIIEEFRKNRKQFNLTGKAPPTTQKAKEKQELEQALSKTIGELDL